MVSCWVTQTVDYITLYDNDYHVNDYITRPTIATYLNH